MVQVVWFKRDLRTTDHRPLAEAAKAGPVLPLYIAEPAYWQLRDTSRRQWLAQRSALHELAGRLGELGMPLVVRMGDVPDILARLHRKVGITRLLTHQETGNAWTFERDRAVRRLCRAAGIPFVEYPQFAVFRGLKDRDEWGRRHAAHMGLDPVPEPARILPVGGIAPGEIPTAEALGLLPDGCERPQPGTRADALAMLTSFLDGRGAGYRREMSSPLTAAQSCSRLSVSLSTGSISVREALRHVLSARIRLAGIMPELRPVPLTAIDSLVSRLHWHCHFIQKLESEPELEVRSLHPAHGGADRDAAPPMLEAWATGNTGFPFVDACMRSLVATGWLNFRMRAMVQAFASYHLNLDWRMSGTRLARLFTDYEPGIHWPQVQMQSGETGINTPRIYNPVKQGLDQDPTGVFTRQWVPELARVPLALLQEPWRLDLDAQRAAGCLIGETYAAAVVDHVEAARAARDRLTRLRTNPSYRADAAAVFTRHGSRKRRPENDNPQKTRAVAGEKARRITRQLSFDL